MIDTSGRNDILVQWFSDAFIRDHKDLFDKVVVQPGEAMFTIRDGKPGDIITETNNELSTGFFGKLKEAALGKKDVQMIYADMKSRVLQIPLSGYTSDRTEIKCVANMMVRISRSNILRVTNLLTRNLVSDKKWGSESHDVKEICDEDLSDFFGYDTQVVVDTTVFGKFDSSKIRDDALEFNKAISDAINTLMPHWAACGLEVEVTSVEVSDNGYEEVMKFKSLMFQTQMIEDIKYAKERGNMKNLASLESEKERLDGEVRMEALRARYLESEFEFGKKWEQELKEASFQAELSEKKRNDAISEAQTAVQIMEIRGASQANLKKMNDEVELYRKEREIELKRKEQSDATDNLIRLRKTEAELDFTKQIEEIKMECAKAVQKAENDVKIAYNEGYNKGREDGMALADRHNREQSDVAVNMMSAMGAISRGQNVPQPSNGCRFCPSCGSPTNGGKFCPSCGSGL